MNKLLLVFLLLFNKAWSQKLIDIQKIEHKIDSIFSSFANTPGLSIGIISEGKLVVNKNFGFANLDHAVRVSDSTIFPVASISKEFTAYCILLLEKEGKLSLKDEIHRYLPQLPLYQQPIFISDLLHHTSGLRDFIELLAVGGWRIEDIISQNDALSVVYRQKGLNFLPRTKYHYTNTNYLLLGEIIKKITGQTLAEYAKANIFLPLKMERTKFIETFRTTVPNLATSYYTAGNTNFRKALLNYAYTGSTGVHSTVQDLGKWITHIIKLYAVNDPLYKKMITLEKLPDGAVNNYASGFFISNTHKNLFMMYHDGYDAAYRSYMACFPAAGSGLVLLSNNDAVNPKYYGAMITDMLITDAPQKNITNALREIKEDINTTSAERKRSAGTYELEGGFVFEIKEEKDVLNVILDGEAFRLFRQAHGEWSVKEFDYNITIGPGNVPGTISVRRNGETTKGHKVKLVTLSKEDAAKYTGRYYSEEVGQAYDVKIINSRLVVSHLKHGEIEMSPFTKDIFRSGGGIFDRIRFERSVKGAVTGFTYFGQRAMGMFFKKIKQM